MTKRPKILSAQAAYIASEKRSNKQVDNTINNCINTINKYIDTATMKGEYTTSVWFHNTNSVLNLIVVNIVADCFREEGYSVEVIQIGKDPDYVKEYRITLSWADAVH